MKRIKKTSVPQMKDGGKAGKREPIYTSDKAKVQAYQDSLAMAVNSRIAEQQFLNQFKYKDITDTPGSYELPTLTEMYKGVKDSYDPVVELIKNGIPRSNSNDRQVVNLFSSDTPQSAADIRSLRNKDGTINRVISSGKYVPNSVANKKVLIADKLFGDDRQDFPQVDHKTKLGSTGNINQVQITPSRRYLHDNGVFNNIQDPYEGYNNETGNKYRLTDVYALPYTVFEHPGMQPEKADIYNYDVGSEGKSPSERHANANRGKKQDPSSWTYDANEMYNVNFPIYKYPVQPYVYQESPPKKLRGKQQISKLPISGQELLSTSQYDPQMSPIQNPYIISEDVWASPKVQGNQYTPAGFRTTSKMKEFQHGGNVKGTKLQSAEEKKYQQWRTTLPTNLQYEGDYDLRGFYKDNPTWSPNIPGQHMTDRYKLPNHPTFSNESMYYLPANKDSAGYWQGNMYIPYNPAVKDTVKEFKDGGITYTGTNRPANKVHYKEGGKVRKDVPKKEIEGRSYYDPFTGSMYLDRSQYNDPAVYNHEAFHEYQDRTGGLSIPEYWEGPLKRPSIVNIDDIKGAYFNRKNIDGNILTDMFLDRNPEFQFVPQDIIRDRFVEDIQYNVPWTEEGEAQQYEKTGKFPDEMRKGGKIPIAKNGIQYTKTANKSAIVTTTQSPGYVPQYSTGEQYMMEHPQQYMRSAEGYGTPQQQRDHDYLRNKMYQQEADERANREFAQKMKPGSELADKILTSDMMISGAGVVNKGLRGISKKVAKKLADDVMPHSGNFPAAYTKGVRGNTPMPTVTEVPPLSAEDKVYQSFGIKPRGTRPQMSDEEIERRMQAWEDYTLDEFHGSPPTEKEIEQSYIDARNRAHKEHIRWHRNDEKKYNVPMFSTKGPSKKGEIFEQGRFHDGNPTPYPVKDWVFNPSGKDVGKVITEPSSALVQGKGNLNYILPERYTNFGPVTPYQRKYEGKGMPKSLIPNELQQNQYGGAIMKKKQKAKNGKVLKAEKGAVASNLLDNPMGQTPTGMSVPMYNNMYGQPGIPQEVSNEFQNYQATQMNDPYANQGQLNKGIPGVSPDVIDQYQEPQPPQQKPAGTVKAGPNFNINTADMVAGTLQGINAILPWQQPRQNKNLYNPAVQNFNNGTGSRASFKKGGKVPKAKKGWDSGDAIGNIRQGFSDQNYVSNEALNHDFSNQDNSFIPVQQDMADMQAGKLGRFGQLATSAPLGASKIDGFRGSKTSAYKYKDAQWQYNHNGQLQDTYNAGKNYEQGIAQDLARTNQQWGTIPGQQAITPQEVASQNWVSNDQGLDVWGNQHNYNKYMKETPAVAANAPIGLPANYTGNYMGKNYIGGKEDTPIAAHGAILPAGNGINIQGKYQPLSGQTIELKDSSHANGGQLVAANGTVIEAEGPNGDGQGGETLHVDQEGNTIVGGNLYVPYTGIKYKKAFREIGKAEAKIGGMQKKLNKQKEKTTIIANNITDPKNRYGAPTAGTVAVLADAHAQEEQGIMQMEEQVSNLKQNLTDMQNAQLVYEGKAKNGAKIPKAYEGYKSKKQYDPITGEPLMYDKPVGGKRFKSTTQRKSSYIAPIDPMAQTSQRFLNTPNPWDNKDPMIPGTGAQSGPVLLPTTTTDDTGQYQWNEQPTLPEVKPYDQLEKEGTEAKKPFKKGLKNKFHIGDYLGEIATLFDRPEPVQSMQVNPILEPEYNLSLQQKKNSILSAYRPVMMGSANSAGQQAAIAGQMAEQLAAVDSEELAMNQQNTGAIRARNLQEVRGTRDMNTQLGQQQYMQQQQARAITDQNRFNAAQSISSKEAQRRAQNNNLSMYEQYTGWAWDPNTKQYQMIHPGYQFDEVTAHAPSIDTEVEKKKKSKEWNYDPRTGKPLKQTELIETAMMGGMMSGPMPGMGGAPMAARKKKAKMGKKLKYC